MALRVQITEKQAKSRFKSGTSSRTHKEYSMNLQKGWLYESGEPHPREIEFCLPDGSAPYPVGDYALNLDSNIYINGFGSINVNSQLVLVPAKV